MNRLASGWGRRDSFRLSKGLFERGSVQMRELERSRTGIKKGPKQ